MTDYEFWWSLTRSSSPKIWFFSQFRTLSSKTNMALIDFNSVTEKLCYGCLKSCPDPLKKNLISSLALLILCHDLSISWHNVCRIKTLEIGSKIVPWCSKLWHDVCLPCLLIFCLFQLQFSDEKGDVWLMLCLKLNTRKNWIFAIKINFCNNIYRVI